MRPKTFLIHPPLDAQTGGPATFAVHLKNFLEADGYRWKPEVDEDLGALIVFVQAPLSLLKKARALGIPILQRLDGLYYRRKHGWWHREYLRTNLKVWFIRRYLCDFIVYQSEFCERMAEAVLGGTRKRSEVVHNGTPDPVRRTDPGSGPVDGGPGRNGPLRLVATGRFRGMDMLPAAIKALDLCAGEFEFDLDVYGEVDAASEPFLQRPYVRYHGKVPNQRVRDALAGYHALLFTQLCAPCPNTVIEAVAAGLPVVAYDSGAIKELLPFNRELVAETPSATLHSARDFDPGKLAECVRRLNAGLETFLSQAVAHRDDYAESKTLAKYLRILDSLRGEG